MEDRPGLFDDTPVLSDTQSDEVVAYRPVSSLAVLGAVLAVASALALVSPWFVWLPAIAAVACFIGARSVAANPEAKTGLGLAKAGLVVSLLLGGAVFARTQYSQQLHQAAARPVAQRFLGRLVDGDVVAAYELTRPLVDRRPSEGEAALYYEADEDAAKRLADFQSSPAVSLLLGLERPPTLAAPLPWSRGRGGRVLLSWRLELPEAAGTGRRVIDLKLDRVAAGSADVPASWRVVDLRLGPVTD